MKNLDSENGSSYGYVMMVLSVPFILLFTCIQYVPSPIMNEIIEQTGWDYSMAGQLVSIVGVLMACGAFFGGPFVEAFGTRKGAIITLVLLGGGCFINFLAGENFALHMFGRVLVGCAYGLFFGIPAAVISAWIKNEQQSFWFGFRTFVDFIGAVTCYTIVVFIYKMVGTWQNTIGVFGGFVTIVLILFIFFWRETDLQKQERMGRALSFRGCFRGVGLVFKNRDIMLMCIGFVGQNYTFSCIQTYMPSYMANEQGLSTTFASFVSASIVLVGAIAAIVCPIIPTVTGRTKLIGWPCNVIMAIGFLICMFSTNTAVIWISYSIAGIGYGVYMVYYCLLPAQISNGNPSFVAASMGITMFSGWLPTLLYPFVCQGLLNMGLSMQTTLLLNIIPTIAGIIPPLLCRETGAKGVYYKEHPYAAIK